jgi:hypothetical protein
MNLFRVRNLCCEKPAVLAKHEKSQAIAANRGILVAVPTNWEKKDFFLGHPSREMLRWRRAAVYSSRMSQQASSMILYTILARNDNLKF